MGLGGVGWGGQAMKRQCEVLGYNRMVLEYNSRLSVFDDDDDDDDDDDEEDSLGLFQP